MDGKQVKVKFPRGIRNDKMACFMWFRYTKRSSAKWHVYRGRKRLGDWDDVKRDETIILKPAKKKK